MNNCLSLAFVGFIFLSLYLTFLFLLFFLFLPHSGLCFVLTLELLMGALDMLVLREFFLISCTSCIGAAFAIKILVASQIF